MSTIKKIMQVGVGAPDRKAFADFSHDMLGLPTTNSPDGNATYLRVDRYPHRLAACTAGEPVLNYIGFGVGGPDALAEWKTQLRAKDIAWCTGSRDECSERQVADFIEFKDPDAPRWQRRRADAVTAHAFRRDGHGPPSASVSNSR